MEYENSFEFKNLTVFIHFSLHNIRNKLKLIISSYSYLFGFFFREVVTFSKFNEKDLVFYEMGSEKLSL